MVQIRLPSDAPAAAGAQAEQAQSLQSSLEQLVAAEDPFSGEVVTRHLDKPFIEPDQQDMVSLWQL